jgi:hypothetical protein
LCLRVCDYRDSTIIKNHLVSFLAYLLHLPFHSSPYLSCLSLIPCAITSLSSACLHPFEHSHTSASLHREWREGLASLFMILKSYSNVCSGELGHLCPSGILRGISLSSTSCLSTWRCHCLFTTTPLMVQVGLVSLGRLFNVVGTVIDPYVELVCASSYRGPLLCSTLNPINHRSHPQLAINDHPANTASLSSSTPTTVCVATHSAAISEYMSSNKNIMLSHFAMPPLNFNFVFE